MPPFPRRSTRSNVLRGNWGTFIDGSADDGGLRGNGVLSTLGMHGGIFLRGEGGCGDGVMGDFVYIYGVIFNVCWL